MKLYLYADSENGLLKNQFTRELEWDNEDIKLANATETPPPEHSNPFTYLHFNTEAQKWEELPNPYQKFTHKLVRALDMDNTNPNNLIATDFTSLPVNPLDNPDEWLVNAERPTEEDMGQTIKYGAKRITYYNDDTQQWELAEPFLEEVQQTKKRLLNADADRLLQSITANVTGTAYTYDLSTQDRQNLTDLILYLTNNPKQESALYRCADKNGVKENRPHTLKQLLQLETLIQEHKMQVLNDCAILKSFVDTLTDIDSVHHLAFTEANAIREGNYGTTAKKANKTKLQVQKGASSTFEKRYKEILKREGLL